MFNTIVNFLTANYGVICAILVGTATLGGLVARLTPNKKDDAFFAKLLGWVHRLPSLGLAPVKEVKKDA